MPYVKTVVRFNYADVLSKIENHMNTYSCKKGHLTYLLYCIAFKYFKYNKSYETISNAISCLQDAAEEIRRRHLNPYEDEKIKQNGDIS